MPEKITSLGKGRYRVSTPHGVKAKSTTKEKAQAQARLLRAVDHGWKPTHEAAAVVSRLVSTSESVFQLTEGDKIRFVVVDENTFGYVYPSQPHTCWIISSKPQKGATRSWQDGSTPLDVNLKGVRPATLSDFNDYHVDPEPYLNDHGRYEIPAK